MQRKGQLYLLFISTFLTIMILCPNLAFCVHKQSSSFICSGCHIIHSSETDLKANLLRYDSDDLCYACHGKDSGDKGVLHSIYKDAPVVRAASLTSTFNADDPNTIGAGGNFASLSSTKDTESTPNQGNGHNLSTTTTGMTPAGGTKAYVMHCVTCHDPHGVAADSGSVDSYRNLKMSPDGDTSYINITAIEGTIQNSNGVYSIRNNKYGSTSSTGSNISAWCKQCHGTFHIKHVDAPIGSKYSLYSSTTHLKLPLEDASTGNTNTDHSGNNSNDRVFCLSCHFPHAGPNPDALRWYNSGGLADGVGCQQCHRKGY